MFTQSRQWHRVFRTCESSHKRRPRRSTKHASPLRLEPLEARTLLNAGDLDPTFGVGGKVLTDFVGSISSQAVATVIQPDGKIVVAGVGSGGVNQDFLLARYNPDGSLDAGFGNGGQVNTEFFAAPFLAPPQSNAVAAVVLQSDGKIVVVGTSQGQPGADGFPRTLFAVARYNINGSLDPTFGNGGTVTTEPGREAVATGAVLQPDGKIIVVGIQNFPGIGAVVRFNNNGTLDSTFGAGGLVVSDTVSPEGVLVQSDGKIIVAGTNLSHTPLVRYNADGSRDTSFNPSGTLVSSAAPLLQGDGKIVILAGNGIARVNPNGTLDSSFGTGGETTAPITITGAALQPDGRIVVIGHSSAPGFAVARFNIDGSLDTSFGISGTATAVIGSNDAAAGVTVQIDGKIVVVGWTGNPDQTSYALARFNPDGSLDNGFGMAGKLTTSFTGTINSTAGGMAIQADGKIIVAGVTRNNYALTRYTANGQLDAAFGNGGKVLIDTVQAFGGFLPASVGIQADGKILVAVADALLRYNPDGTPDSTFGTGGKVLNMLGFTGGPVFQSDGKILVLGNALARFNADGSLDTSFGVGGSVPVVSPIGVTIQPDGKILVLKLGNYGIVEVARYNPDGTPDSGFGAGGTLTLFSIIEPEPGTPLVAQPDGKFAVGTPPIRFHNDGTVDPLFGPNGRLGIDFSVSAMALAPDGRILFAGFTGPNSSTVVVTKPTGGLDVRFGNGGRVITDFTVSAVAFGPDGNILVAGSTTANGRMSFTVARYLSTGGSSLSPNQLFVAEIYPDLLQRPVDAGGLAAWSNLLDSGVSRAQVVQGIMNSREYRTIEVNNLYMAVLSRPADSSIDGWINFLDQGGTAAQVEAMLLGSDEFFAAHGSDNSNGFLPALYQIVLERPIDSSGAQHWGQVLQSGTLSRQAVAAAVLTSLEADRLDVQTFYQQFLHRSADPFGLDAFTNALQQGMSNEQLAVLFMTSAEYFERV